METGEEVGVASEIEYLIKWKGKSYLHSSWHTGSVWARSQALPLALAIMTGDEAGECVKAALLQMCTQIVSHSLETSGSCCRVM